jgi:hypothetical protein
MRPISIIPSNTLTPSATSIATAEQPHNIRAVAGGVAGGIFALGLLASMVFLVLRRHRRRHTELVQCSYEAPDGGLVELSPGVAKFELYAHDTKLQELDAHVYRIELEGDQRAVAVRMGNLEESLQCVVASCSESCS